MTWAEVMTRYTYFLMTWQEAVTYTLDWRQTADGSGSQDDLGERETRSDRAPR